MAKIQNGCPQESDAPACVRTWISRDPLPGHRASSTPGCVAGAVAGWPWPVSPGCSPPAGAPGQGCPFLRRAAAVAASSPARAACAAQPSDWTSRQRETSSANTHSEQPCRHDNLSIHPFTVQFRLPVSSIQRAAMCPNNLAKLLGRWEKFISFLSSAQDDIWCVYIWFAPPPSHHVFQLYRPALHVPIPLSP